LFEKKKKEKKRRKEEYVRKKRKAEGDLSRQRCNTKFLRGDGEEKKLNLCWGAGEEKEGSEEKM